MHRDDDDDEHFILGAHGTLAPQKDEAYYDDRSDADDDLEKGKLKFPSRLYGRDRELETLLNIYGDLDSTRIDGGRRVTFDGEDAVEPNGTVEGGEFSQSLLRGSGLNLWSELLSGPPNSFMNSRVVFLSGYSGIGKSKLVAEFVEQIRTKHQTSEHSPILSFSGKYNKRSNAAAAPFSAITDLLESLTMHLTKRRTKREPTPNNDFRAKVKSEISKSDLIGPGTHGSSILQLTWPILEPLFGSCADNSQARKLSGNTSMDGIKECTLELFRCLGNALEHPLVFFLDDLQWGDECSLDLLSFLLSNTGLRNIMIICSYRSNEVHNDHPFTTLMENITTARKSNGSSTSPKSVAKMDLFGLSLKVVTKFISECLNKEDNEEVAELAEAVYTKTMGNVFYVREALEELVRKNVLFYDVMIFEWQWVASKVEMDVAISNDVVETLNGKINQLSSCIQRVLVVMAYIPNMVNVSTLKLLMSDENSSLEETEIGNALNQAVDEGMLIFQSGSGNYVFAHEACRQAMLSLVEEKDRDELLMHMSGVLLKLAHSPGPETEWCLYTALDLLKTLPPQKTNHDDLAKLHLRVCKIARRRGSIAREKQCLGSVFECLQSSGLLWKDYSLTLEIYERIIISEYTLGSYDNARAAIDEIFKHARSLNEKLVAHIYLLKCNCDESRDYSQGVKDGIGILNKYGHDIPLKPKKSYMVAEEMKLKMALRNRSYSRLTDLPIVEDPIINLFFQTCRYATLSGGEDRSIRILAWKATRCALKYNGIDSYLPTLLAWLGTVLSKKGKVKSACDIANVALELSEKTRDNDRKSYAITNFVVSACVDRLSPFYIVTDRLFQCHQCLKVAGHVEPSLGCILCYFQAYFAAGVELGPKLESVLLCVEYYGDQVDRSSFLRLFQMYRQFALNLRKTTEQPTEFLGEAFHEEKVLSKMEGKARSMLLRDSSVHRLMLAFVFWDEDCMCNMLEILSKDSFSLSDHVIPRGHNRICFTGLAAFAMGNARKNRALKGLGQKCLSYFEHLSKLGSINARPVYLFMLAMKRPSRGAFESSIDACAKARFGHLEAMVKERYAVFLRGEGDVTFANECIQSSYLLYRGWGAQAKALKMSESCDILKGRKRVDVGSLLAHQTSYYYNSTSKSARKLSI